MICQNSQRRSSISRPRVRRCSTTSVLEKDDSLRNSKSVIKSSRFGHARADFFFDGRSRRHGILKILDHGKNRHCELKRLLAQNLRIRRPEEETLVLRPRDEGEPRLDVLPAVVRRIEQRERHLGERAAVVELPAENAAVRNRDGARRVLEDAARPLAFADGAVRQKENAEAVKLAVVEHANVALAVRGHLRSESTELVVFPAPKHVPAVRVDRLAPAFAGEIRLRDVDGERRHLERVRFDVLVRHDLDESAILDERFEGIEADGGVNVDSVFFPESPNHESRRHQVARPVPRSIFEVTSVSVSTSK